MLPVVFEEFELVCIFCCCFSFLYHHQLVEGQLHKNLGWLQPPSPPGFYGPEYFRKLPFVNTMAVFVKYKGIF